MTRSEESSSLEEGRMFLACESMRRFADEEALELFEKLDTPESAFYQAQV